MSISYSYAQTVEDQWLVTGSGDYIVDESGHRIYLQMGMYQNHVLTIPDCRSLSFFDILTLPTSDFLHVQDSLSACASDSHALNEGRTVSLQDLLSGSSSDNVATIRGKYLTIQDSSSSTTVDSFTPPALDIPRTITVTGDEAISLSTSDYAQVVREGDTYGDKVWSTSELDSPFLSQAWIMNIQEAVSGAPCDKVDMRGIFDLTIEDVQCASTSGNIGDFSTAVPTMTATFSECYTPAMLYALSTPTMTLTVLMPSMGFELRNPGMVMTIEQPTILSTQRSA